MCLAAAVHSEYSVHQPAGHDHAVWTLMIAFLSLLLHVVISPLKTKAQLEAEIILLRHQLNVLRRRVPSKPRLAVADRLLFVWFYPCAHRC